MERKVHLVRPIRKGLLSTQAPEQQEHLTPTRRPCNLLCKTAVVSLLRVLILRGTCLFRSCNVAESQGAKLCLNFAECPMYPLSRRSSELEAIMLIDKCIYSQIKRHIPWREIENILFPRVSLPYDCSGNLLATRKEAEACYRICRAEQFNR